MVFALWDRARLAEDSAVEDARGWGGVTLAHNVASREQVDAVIEEARAAGATIGREPAPTFWGGYSSVFIDPEGHPLGGRAQPALDAHRRWRRAPESGLLTGAAPRSSSPRARTAKTPRTSASCDQGVLAAPFAAAVPMISGRTHGGAFASSSRSTSLTSKPAPRMLSSVRRLQLQPCPIRLLMGSMRSCNRALRGQNKVIQQ